MIKIIPLNLFCLFSLLLLLSSAGRINKFKDIPTIKAGTAKITGNISVPNEMNKDSIFVNITVTNPISGEYVKYKALVDQFGKFSIDVDVETNVSLVRFFTSLNTEKALLVKLKNGDVTNIDIAYNADSNIENIDIQPEMNKNDVTGCFDLIHEMLMIQSPPDRAPEPLHKMSPDYFMNYINAVLSGRLAIINKDTLISKELKNVLYNEFSLFTYSRSMFDYRGERVEDDKDKGSYVKKIDRSYYRFLKDFKLNDPQNLNTFSFLEFQNKILENDILALPEIGESDIPSWLAQVKVVLADLVGFNDGPYYDILAANAYGKQLTEEVRPLSEKQKENI